MSVWRWDLHRCRWTAVLRSAVIGLVVVLAAASCAGAETVVGAGEVSEGSEGDLSTAVAFLGDSATAVTEAVTMTIDGAGATIELGDGTRLIAPSGAFPTATDVTLQRFAIDSSALSDPAPWLTAVVASTPVDVDLGQPVIVEVDRPAAKLAAAQVADGVVSTALVSGTDRASVEVKHFSDVVTLFGEGLDPARATANSLADREADAEFLSICSLAIAGMFGGFANDGETTGFAVDRALSFCATALVRRTSPTGVTVSTRCVGDAMTAGLDLRPAIASCADASSDADDRSESDASGAASSPSPSPTVATEVPVRAGLVDSGRTTWLDTIGPIPDAPQTVTLVDPPDEVRVFPYVLGDALVEITRTSGTNDFAITIEATRESAKKYALSSEALQALLDADVIDTFEPNYCRTLTNVTFVGTGTFQDTTPNDRYVIIFEGVHDSVELRECELEDLEPFESSRESSLWVDVTDAGLELHFNEYKGTLPGAAVPLGD